MFSLNIPITLCKAEFTNPRHSSLYPVYSFYVLPIGPSEWDTILLMGSEYSAEYSGTITSHLLDTAHLLIHPKSDFAFVASRSHWLLRLSLLDTKKTNIYTAIQKSIPHSVFGLFFFFYFAAANSSIKLHHIHICPFPQCIQVWCYFIFIFQSICSFAGAFID